MFLAARDLAFGYRNRPIGRDVTLIRGFQTDTKPRLP